MGSLHSAARTSTPTPAPKATPPRVTRTVAPQPSTAPTPDVSRGESADRAPRFDIGTVALYPPARALRPMPGGATTRPLGRVETRGAPVSPGPSLGAIPSSVAATVGAFGTHLLRAALTPRAPVGPTAQPLSRLAGGSPVPAWLRAPFEQSYGYDLSPVRLHTGPTARQAARSVGAAAFTLGDHIVLGGDVDVASGAGRHILGHELAHTVQARLGGGRGRISEPSWPSEREAERATRAALLQSPYELTEGAGEDLHRIAPWLVLAGIGLVAGVVTWATSDSTEENQRRHAAGAPDPSRSLWALVPVYGSVQQIREAESFFLRALGMGFMMVDFATLGAAGVAGRALIRVPVASYRTAVARRAAGELVVREGGEILTEAMARETAAAFSREGGAVFATRTAATAELERALGRGAMVAVTEGGLNHAVIYARNSAGQVLKLHGGPLRVLFPEVPQALTPQLAASVARRANAYVVIEAAEAAVSIEQAVAVAQRGGNAILRWLRGTPTSCGIMQGAILEASGLSAQTLARLLPSGGAAARLLPITLLEHMAGNAGLRFVEGGMARIIGGTAIQSGLSAVGGGVGVVTSTLMRVFAGMLEPEAAPTPARRPRTGSTARRTPESDAFARAIIERWGRTLLGPASMVSASLPDIIPGWMLTTPEFRQSVLLSLVAQGMSPASALAVVSGG